MIAPLFGPWGWNDLGHLTSGQYLRFKKAFDIFYFLAFMNKQPIH